MVGVCAVCVYVLRSLVVSVADWVERAVVVVVCCRRSLKVRYTII